MSEVRQESPLVQFLTPEWTGTRPTGAAGVELRERAFMGHLNLRGDTADQAFLDAVQAALRFGLPIEPNTVAEGGEFAALWLGPNEWLVLTPSGRETALAGALRDSLGEVLSSVVDVTGGQTVINLHGPHVRDLLAKGCTLDLHPRAFGPGRCAQSLVAKASVTVRQLDDSPSFDLIVRRSFADYLAIWIEDAAQEYGLAVMTDKVE